MRQQIKSKRGYKLEDTISINNGVVTVYLDKCAIKLDLEDYQAIKNKGYGVFSCASNNSKTIIIRLNSIGYCVANVLFNIKEKENLLHIDGDIYNFCRDNCIVMDSAICLLYHKYKNDRDNLGTIVHITQLKNNTMIYSIIVRVYNVRKKSLNLTASKLTKEEIRDLFIKKKVEPFLDSLGLLNIKPLSKEDINKYKNHNYIYSTKKRNKNVYKIKYKGENVYLYFNNGDIVIYDKKYYEDAINKGYSVTSIKNQYTLKKINKLYEAISKDKNRVFLNGNKFDYRKSNCIVVPINIKYLYNNYINNNWNFYFANCTRSFVYKVRIDKCVFQKSSRKSKEDAFEKFKNEVIVPTIEPLLRSYGLIK